MNIPIRILLVDDSPYFIEAACEFIRMNEALDVSGIATTGQDAVTQARHLQPDIVLLDVNLGNQSGLELIPQFRKIVPESKIIILSIMDDESYRIAAFQAGVHAYVHKSEMVNKLFSIIFDLTDAS